MKDILYLRYIYYMKDIYILYLRCIINDSAF